MIRISATVFLMMRQKAMLGIVLFLMAGCIFPAAVQAQKLAKVKGVVEVKKKGKSWRKGKNGMKIKAGDRIRTKRGGSCVIVFGKIASIKLKPYTNFTITRASLSSGKANIHTNLLIGKTYHKIKRALSSGSSYTVQTPTAIAGVKSTYFSAEVKSDGTSTFNTYELSDPNKKLEVSAQGKTEGVGVGETSTVEPGATPSEAELLSEEEKKQAEEEEEDLGKAGTEDVTDYASALSKLKAEMKKAGSGVVEDLNTLLTDFFNAVDKLVEQSKEEVRGKIEQAKRESTPPDQVKNEVDNILKRVKDGVGGGADQTRRGVRERIKKALDGLDAIRDGIETSKLTSDQLAQLDRAFEDLKKEVKKGIEEEGKKTEDRIAEKVQNTKQDLDQFLQSLGLETIVEDNIPPIIVVTSPPMNSVFKMPNVTLQCKTEPKAKVTVNGAPANVGLDGTCTASIALLEGRNILNIEARDAAGNTGSVQYILILDTMPPFLTLQSPQANFQTCEPIIQIVGITEPKARVRIQGQNIKVGSSGNFQVPFPLKPGGNQIKIESSDQADNIAQLIVNGKYDPVASFLNVTNPPDNFVVHKPQVKVLGFTKPKTIVRINQRTVYVDPAGAFNMIVPLMEGKNRIVIDAQSTCGDKLSVTKNVTYTDIPPQPPNTP